VHAYVGESAHHLERELAARQVRAHRTALVAAPGHDRGDRGGARAGVAGEGDAAVALPDD
jgi:hypothetical protein